MQALYATGYGNKDGPKGDLFGLAKVSDNLNAKLQANGGSDAKTWRELILTDGDLSKPNPYADSNYQNLNDPTVLNKIITTIKTAIDNGRWIPVEIVIARPFIEHLMLSAIVTVAGRDTGATLFGPADM